MILSLTGSQGFILVKMLNIVSEKFKYHEVDATNKSKTFYEIYKQVGSLQTPATRIPFTNYGTEMKI